MGFAFTSLPMEDELLQSIIFRFEDNNMLPKNVFYANFISNDPVSIARPQNIKIPMGSNLYVPKVAEILNMKPHELFLQTSIYPGTTPLMTAERQTRTINRSFRKNNSLYPNLIGMPYPDLTEYKFCPVCYRNDMEQYGFTWLRRAHHMPGVDVCWNHGVKLEKTITGKGVFDLQLSYPYANPIPGNNTEREFALFSHDFINANLDLNEFLSTQIILSITKSSGRSLSKDIAKILHLPEESVREGTL